MYYIISTLYTSLESKLPPVTIPLPVINSQALNADPPLQPNFSSSPQDIRFCADKFWVNVPLVAIQSRSVKVEATATA